MVNKTMEEEREKQITGEKKEDRVRRILMKGLESWKDVEVNKAKRWPTGSLQTMKEDGDENDKSCEVVAKQLAKRFHELLPL